MYNKANTRELYYDLVQNGLYSRIDKYRRMIYYENKRKEDCIKNKTVYLTEAHYLFELRRALEFLYSLKNNYSHLFYECMVGSGPVNNGESWGDFYEMFPINKRNNEDIIELFNEFQKETPYGYYLEIKKE